MVISAHRRCKNCLLSQILGILLQPLRQGVSNRKHLKEEKPAQFLVARMLLTDLELQNLRLLTPEARLASELSR